MATRNVLDRSDIDALMSAVSAGEIEPTVHEGQIFSRHRTDLEKVEIRDYDFRRPERIGKNRLRTMQAVHETFARSFGAFLSGLLRTTVEVRVAGAEQRTCAEFLAGLPGPTSFNLISAPGLDGTLCLEICPLIIYSIVDRLLGGSGEEAFIPQRPLTVIETRLVRRILVPALHHLSDAWSSVRDVAFTLGEMESDPRVVQILPPHDVVAVIRFEVKLGSRAGTMSLAIPVAVAEPFVESFRPGGGGRPAPGSRDGHDWGRLIARLLAGVRLEVTAVLAETQITVDDLRNLEVGDLLVTDTPASAPATICLGSVPKLLGDVGRHQGHRAVRVRGRVQERTP